MWLFYNRVEKIIFFLEKKVRLSSYKAPKDTLKSYHIKNKVLSYIYRKFWNVYKLKKVKLKRNYLNLNLFKENTYIYIFLIFFCGKILSSKGYLFKKKVYKIDTGNLDKFLSIRWKKVHQLQLVEG